jgi:hypothetical protein
MWTLYPEFTRGTGSLGILHSASCIIHDSLFNVQFLMFFQAAIIPIIPSAGSGSPTALSPIIEEQKTDRVSTATYGEPRRSS